MARNQAEAANESDVTLNSEGTMGFDDVTARGERSRKLQWHPPTP